MTANLSVFDSPEAEASFTKAYDAVLGTWPVPYESRFVATSFGQTHVIISGDPQGPPVVLLPPGGSHAPIWVRNVGTLSRTYRVYAVDIIGELNRSRPTRPIKTHAGFMEWITELFDGLELRQVNLIGNSNGGFFALETALLRPERVDKVVLISPAATFVQMWAWWRHLLVPAHIIAPLIHSERMVMKAYDWLWQGFPMDDCYRELRLQSKLTGKKYRPSINSAMPRVLSDSELRRIKARTLLLIGDHEVIYNSVAVIRRATSLVRGLQAKIVKNANHSAQYTAPDSVNAEILNFLRRDN